MRHEGNDEVLLFESEEDEEALRISCRATKEGGLVIHQMSEGGVRRGASRSLRTK